MKEWKDAWIIFAKDLRLDRMYLVWNLVFMIYTGIMMSTLFHSREEARAVMNPMADFLLLILVPMVGFYFSRRSFNYIKEDSYTKMLLHYRTLPIPDTTIMKSRLIQLATAIPLNSLILFTTVYFMFVAMGIKMGLAQYLAFVLTWIGYVLAMNGLYIYFEFMKKGRTYLWMMVLQLVVIAVGAFAVSWFDGNLLQWTLDYSERHALLSPVMWGTLVVGAVILSIFCSITRRSLNKRDLAR
ncbi:hypothetical protein [Paenibacillus vini]|uniref:ABC transporter permease n=1 Tax=Paenibacillus vini TaxID=1476024 RepID=A0ABQ4ME40_9BACL|nr:hypothetical protein [Paenibacillus vini]MDN4069770.1 hypothetical protein [Paenibacillus vini]GIP54218.1 hypothetical protein J42TS3_32530 [Paenibacillus vini]